MKRPDTRWEASRYLVMGLLALASCGRGDAPSDAAPLKRSAAALESGADLVVTELRGPASVRDGHGFTATVKVCNQGTVAHNNRPLVELFLSTDAELTLPDPNTPPGSAVDQVVIGSIGLNQQLYPGQCETRSVNVYATLPPAAQGPGAYYLAAAVDTQNDEQELREDNNILVSGLMGVGYGADLVVRSVKAPASARGGYGFKATVEVCNQGTTPTQAGSSYPYYDRSRVELFLSMDAELTLPDPSNPSPSIPMEQVSVGYVDVDPLGEGQCVKKEVQASSSLPPAAQGDGAYYLVAAADTNRLEPELREDNNVLVSGLMGVGNLSDLVVTGVTGPASARNGQGFTARVKVCNQGTTPTGGAYPDTRVDLFLLADAALSMPAPGQPADPMPIESVELEQPLYPGQCVTKSVPAAANPPPGAPGDGAYYLAAAVDTSHLEQELREDNNVLVGGLMGVGHRPDFVVTRVSAPASVRSGQDFLASVEVCNQGTASTYSYYPGARLELFLSTDTELTLPDPSMPYPGPPPDQMSLGYMELYESLSPAQCVTKEVYVSAYPPMGVQGNGAFHLAAAIDTTQVENELREDNNVLVGGLMGVGHGADLVVTGVGAPASLRSGQSFTASVKVCNQGTQSTSGGGYPYYSSPRVELFLSTDTEVTLPDPSSPSPGPAMEQMSIGHVELYETLSPAQCVTKSVYASANPPPAAMGEGAFYLAAAVDTQHVEQELREDNNVHVGGLVGVGHRADLVVTQVSAPASLRPGQSFTASVKVCNQGSVSTSNSYSTRLELFLSTDTEVTLPDPSMPYPGPPPDQMSIGHVDLNQHLEPKQCVTKSVYANAQPPPTAQGEGAYYLAAAIDTTQAEQELREDNNVLVSGLVGVGHRPDFVVTRVSGPASVRSGQDFLASVEVCNQGSVSSYGNPRLELYLSMDSELARMDPSVPYPAPPMDQQLIASVDLNQSLNAGQCVTQSVQAHADLPPAAMGEGAYYLAAAIDTFDDEQELREDNNTLVGGLVGVGHRADLVVTQVSAPASVLPGQGFKASVKVCNQGTSPTENFSGTRLELFLSADTELTLPDPYNPHSGPYTDQMSIGFVDLTERLHPAQCVTKSMNVSAHQLPGSPDLSAYYLAAAVDTYHHEYELREDNNVHVGGPLGVGQRADLVVSEVSAPASIAPGQGFTASVKVCNQGTTTNQNTDGTRLELFLSADTEVTLPDPSMPYPGPSAEQMPLGYVDLNQQLNAGQCVTQSVQAHASLPPGTQGDGVYYLAAAIDTTHAEQELLEDNNVHVGGLVGVGSRADLVVTQVSGPESVWNGQSFTATVKVCNQGTGPTDDYNARLELFLSMDTELTLQDPSMPYPVPTPDQASVGYVDLNQSLHAGQCTTRSVPAYAQPPPGAPGDGAYYLAAAVDTLHSEQELREDNNALVSGRMGVGSRADLVVSEVSAPASVWEGQSFTASVKVCNRGTAPTVTTSYGPRLELFLSLDTELTLPDPYLPYPGPSMDQQSIGYVELNQQLDAGQCVTRSVQAYASLPPLAQGNGGAYYLVAAIDPTHYEQELREDNNVHVSGLMGVGYGPDLVVSGLSAPASVAPGQGFTASVQVCNQGTAPTDSYASGPRVELFLSMDAGLFLPDPSMPSPGMPLDQVSIGYVELTEQLNPGQCVTKSVPGSAVFPPAAPNDGAFFLAAAVDTTGWQEELREDNNVHVGGLIGVGQRADLVVTEVNAPASVGYSGDFTASVKVCNQGTTPTSTSFGTRVELYLSTDAELTQPDPGNPSPGLPEDQWPAGYVELDQGLSPGQCVTRSVNAHAYLPPIPGWQEGSPIYLAAIVDTTDVEQELREDNNIHVDGRLGLGDRADLVVSAVEAPASVEHGQDFTASVKVCNQGTTPTNGYSYSYGPTVELYLSTDAELTPPDPNTPSTGMQGDQMPIGYVQLDQTLYPGQCVTKNVEASAQLPMEAQGDDGAYYLAAIVDTNHSEMELREDNNVHVSGLIGVGYGSDLVVSEVSGPASADYGQPFTASVKVCNQGTTPADSSFYKPRLELYLSMDTELTLPSPGQPYPSMARDQTLVGSVELDQAVAPGQCVTKSVPANAARPEAAQGDGAYYLVAAVDTHQALTELREDNNVRVGGLLGVGYRPDLVVTEVSAPANVDPSQSFTASVKVCNQGTSTTNGGAWYGPRLELLLSVDDELTLPSPGQPYPSPNMQDEQRTLASVELEQSLAPGQCVTKSLSASAWPVPGSQDEGLFYLAAVIDTLQVEQELREDNNAHVGSQVGVGFRSDLVVSEVSAPPSAEHGDSFTASVKVCNQGTTPSSGGSYSGPRVELFLSVDDELTLPAPGQPYPPPGMPQEQMPIGYVELNQPLQPGQCVTKSVPAKAYPPDPGMGEGAFYLAAAVDTTHTEQELREENNVLVGGLIGVGYRPDLVVSELSAPANVENGQSFTASVKVCNQGTTHNGSYYGPRVDLFLSMDTELTLPFTGQPSPPPMTQDQMPIGSVHLSQPLAPGQCVTESVQAQASLPPAAQGDGTYYLAAAVDTLHSEQELREDNNVLVSGLMGVGDQPDLVASELSAPPSAYLGESFTASVKVCNQGTTPTSGGSYSGPRVELFLSMDTALTLPSPGQPPAPGSMEDQTPIGYVELNQPLAPGQCVTVSVPAHASRPPAAPGDGAYYLVAAIDTNHAEQELREDNNVHVGGLMGVGYLPDLVVTEVVAPASLQTSMSTPITVKVCNQGTAISPGPISLRVLLSMNPWLTTPAPSGPMPTDQTVIGGVNVDPLAAGQCVTKDVSVYVTPPSGFQLPGVYHLGAIIDEERWAQELREDNNTRMERTVELTH